MTESCAMMARLYPFQLCLVYASQDMMGKIMALLFSDTFISCLVSYMNVPESKSSTRLNQFLVLHI